MGGGRETFVTSVYTSRLFIAPENPILPIVEKRGDIVRADNEGPTVDAIFSFMEINGETEQRGDIFPRK